MERPELYTVDEVAKLSGKSRITIACYAKNNTIPSFRYGKIYLMPPEAIPIAKEHDGYRNTIVEREGYLYINDVAEKLGISKQRVYMYCVDGHMDGAEKFDRAWYVPNGTVNLWSKFKDPSPQNIRAYTKYKALTYQQAARNLQCSVSHVRALVYNKHLEKVQDEDSGRPLIPIDSIKKYLQNKSA